MLAMVMSLSLSLLMMTRFAMPTAVEVEVVRRTTTAKTTMSLSSAKWTAEAADSLRAAQEEQACFGCWCYCWRWCWWCWSSVAIR